MSFSVKGIVAKTSSQNVGDLAQLLESREGLAIIIENNFITFIAHKEQNEVSRDLFLVLC